MSNRSNVKTHYEANNKQKNDPMDRFFVSESVKIIR